jgi:hypothetical protein
MNVFYAGVENNLSIVVNGYKSEELNPLCSKASIQWIRKDYWKIIPDTGIRSLNIYVTNSLGDTLNGKYGWSFRIKKIPESEISVGGLKLSSKGDTAFLEQYRLWPGPYLGAKYSDFLLDIRAKVLSYEVEVNRNGKKVYDFGKIVQSDFKWSKTYTRDSLTFTHLDHSVIVDKWVDTLRFKLQENDQVMFRNIVVQEADNRIRVIPELDCYWKPKRN